MAAVRVAAPAGGGAGGRGDNGGDGGRPGGGRAGPAGMRVLAEPELPACAVSAVCWVAAAGAELFEGTANCVLRKRHVCRLL